MLGASEIYLILRARNEASLVLRNLGNELEGLDRKALASSRAQMARGSAMAAVGLGIAAVGAIGVAAMNRMTDEAIKYNKSVALTKTQVDKAQVSFKELWGMGLRVAKTVPVAFDQIQSSLYDIFSSLDTNGPGAEMILKAIAKAAVGGATNMATAGRAIIGVLNAYKLPAQQVTHISDIMFQLVRKGVGTYEQFTNTIGRAIPSAIKAGQSFESLAGMMAFLTRNGLSTAMAATSTARALDALANPKTVAHFKAMGISIYDIRGRMKPVVDIMQELRDKMKGFTPQQKAATIFELFKGSGGTIQAMRFFNHGVNDSNNLLGQLTKSMYASKGAAEEAYKVMANTPANKIQLMKNKYEALRIELGNNLIPIKMALINAISKLLGWIDKIPGPVKAAIAIFFAFAAVAAVVVGVIIAISGAMLMLSAAAAVTDIAFAPIIGAIVGIIAGFAMMAVQIYLVIHYWKVISGFAVRIWNDIYKTVSGAVAKTADFIAKTWSPVAGFLVRIWNNIYDVGTKVWNSITHAVMNAVNFMKVAVVDTWHAIYTAVFAVVHAIQTVISALTMAFDAVWKALVIGWNAVAPTLSVIGKIFYAIFGGIAKVQLLLFRAAYRRAMEDIQILWDSIGKPVLRIIEQYFDITVKNLTAVLHALEAAWRWVWGAIQHYANITINNFKIALHGMEAAWRATWSAIKAFWEAVGNGVMTAIRLAVTFLKNTLATTWAAMKNAWNGLWSFFRAVWNGTGGATINNVGAVVSRLWNKVLHPIFNGIGAAWSNLWKGMGAAFSSIWAGIARGIQTGLNIIINILNGFVSGIDWILGKLPGHFHIDKIPLLGGGGTGNLKGTSGVLQRAGRAFKSGGVLPGWSPGVDNIALPHYLFSGGEGILTPEATRAIGGKKGIDRINSLFTHRNGPKKSGHFLFGGIVGDIASAVKGTVSSVVSGIRKGVAAILRAGLNVAEAPVKFALNRMPTGLVKSIASGGFFKLDEVVRGMINSLGGKARKAAAAQAAAAAKVAASGTVTGAGALANQKYAASQLARFGWGTDQMGSLINLWNGESGWNQFALNASSGAYGIPQSLPANKMASSGADWQTNPATQINWGMNYIKQVYGSPASAYSQWLGRSPHWYKHGAWNISGDQNAILHNREMVLPANAADRIRDSLDGEGSRYSKPEQHFHINTHEIDPKVHAAELGWEIAVRADQ